MAEQLLDGPEVRAAIEKMACKCVPQDVRAHAARVEAGGVSQFLQLLAEALPSEIAFGAF